MKRIGGGVVSAVVAPAVPRDAAAQGDRGSTSEIAELRAWQAQSPESAAFEGGAPPNNLWIGLGVVVLLVIVIYWLFVDPSKVKPGA
jgi:hypothetical protein